MNGRPILKILVLEPYYDGSHRSFLAGLQQHLQHEFDLKTLPARRWKWRMRLAAPFFAEQLNRARTLQQYDRILCSSFVDVAAFRSLLHEKYRQIPIHTYFHENQFAYPVQKEDERDFHFGLTNLTTFMASDKAAFNSRYNLESLVSGTETLLKICPDMKFYDLTNRLRNRAVILHPGIDFSDFPEPASPRRRYEDPPVIVWNHRWEHDKNPEYFFETLYELDKRNIDFRLIVMGQSFKRQPPVFAEAEEKLAHRIDQFGYVRSRKEYIKQLCRSDIVVSTATHEFYGISVIEAVRAGCMPLLPNRLSYPELFPAEYLYEEGELLARLKLFLENKNRLNSSEPIGLTGSFSWTVVKEKYLDWFE
jgi:glycosyltransferase involved in cell wall biosynthesis